MRAFRRAARLGIPAVPLLIASGCAHRAAESTNVDPPPEVVIDERLGVDDVFEVRVFEEPTLTGLFRVTADGAIDYPLIGRITVIAQSSGDVQKVISDKLGEYVKSPQVTVTVKEWNSRKVSVLGQVQKPGPVPYFSRMTIVDAIASAGGFTGIAAKNSVTLRREAKGIVVSRTYPVAEITAGRYPNVGLAPNDVLVVEERMF